MANTKAAGDSGASSSTSTAGTNADAETGKGGSESFKPVEMSRTRDGQKRTAHSLEDVVAFEFDGFRKPTK